VWRLGGFLDQVFKVTETRLLSGDVEQEVIELNLNK
jgi:hypothetical protein